MDHTIASLKLLVVCLALAAALAAPAQTVPFSFEASGTIDSADPARWPDAPAGSEYAVKFDLQLDISAPFSSSATSTEWLSTGTATFNLGTTPQFAETGPCIVQTERNPFNDGRDYFRLFLNINEPGGTRLWVIQLRTLPGDQIDIAAPPSASIVNALPASEQANNPFAFYEQLPNFVIALRAEIDTFTADGGAPPPAPMITSQPVGDIVNPGDAATFSVAAEGLELTYAWRKDGTPLTDGPNVSGANTPNLTVNAADDARYDVVVANPGGSATSSPAILAVRTPCPADQNFDGLLSPADFNAWILNYNIGCQ